MSNQILGEIIGGYIIDEKGTKLNLGKISNVTFEQNVNYYDNLCCCSVSFPRNGIFTLEVEPDENGNLFTIEVPQQEEKGERELMKRKVDFPNLDTIEFVSTMVREDFEPIKRNEEVKEMTINLGGNSMNTNMFGNMFKNMKFGKVETNDIKYSMKGIAFKTTDGDYVCYNPDFTFTNVANMVMDMPMFAMPVSKDQIKTGDVIKHNDAWVIVNSVTPTEIKVAKPWTKEIVSVIPETSIFGFSFYTKVINPFENFGATATADNPFGNMLPFLMMREGDDKSNMLMAMMMQNGQFDMSNPMMMYAMLGGEGKDNDMLMAMMMMQNMGKGCQCGGGCKCKEKVEDSVDENMEFWVDYANMCVDDCTIDFAAMDIDNTNDTDTKED